MDDEDLAHVSSLNALVIALLEQGALDGARYKRHLCKAANRLEEQGFHAAAQYLDQQIEWLDDVLQAQERPQEHTKSD